MATEKTDVVIIGVGAAGGILAAELGKAGMKVIGLERGPRLTTQDFNPHDELRYFQRQDLRPNIKRQPLVLQDIEAGHDDQRLAVADGDVPAIQLQDGHGAPSGLSGRGVSGARRRASQA